MLIRWATNRRPDSPDHNQHETQPDLGKPTRELTRISEKPRTAFLKIVILIVRERIWYHMSIDLKDQPSHYRAQQSAQQLRSFGLLSRFSCASVSIISSFLATINRLLTNTYKSTVQTVDPKVARSSRVGLV